MLPVLIFGLYKTVKSLGWTKIITHIFPGWNIITTKGRLGWNGNGSYKV